jgi:hypothetical protein
MKVFPFIPTKMNEILLQENEGIISSLPFYLMLLKFMKQWSYSILQTIPWYPYW